MNRVEICGNIASGKTTLTQQAFPKRCSPIFENFQSNPFYEAFYFDPVAYSFETELTFLLQHYHSIKVASKNDRLLCDFSLLQDLAYADVNLSGNRHHIFTDLIHEIQLEIGHPNTIIFITCPENILLERIKSRNREAETSITIDYLNALAEALSSRVKSICSETNVISIDSHLIDFRAGVENIPELANL